LLIGQITKNKTWSLATWKDAPQGKIQKFDVSVVTNYLTEHEMTQLQRLVSAYLDVAEFKYSSMRTQPAEFRLCSACVFNAALHLMY